AAARIQQQAQTVGAATLVRTIDELANALTAVREGDDARMAVEIALLKAARPDLDPSTEGLLRRIEKLEAQLAATVPTPPAPAPAPQPPTPTPEPGPLTPEPTPPTPTPEPTPPAPDPTPPTPQPPTPEPMPPAPEPTPQPQFESDAPEPTPAQ